MFFRGGKRHMRYMAALLAAVMAAALLASCDDVPALSGISVNPSAQPDSPQATNEPPPPETVNPNEDPDDIGMELDPGLPPLTGPPAIPLVLTPVASGTNTESNEKALVDYSNAADGYVMVKWTGGPAAVGLRIQIFWPGSANFNAQYTLGDDASFEVYPLAGGSGEYTVKVVDLLGDGRGAVALSATFNTTLTDEFAPFLHPNQYVNFNEDSRVVAKASELISAQADFIEKIRAVYNFVTTNITYDRDLANEIIAGMHPNYLPVLDNVLDRKKGICFDFAAVMAAMLRSQGIPTKLVVGDVNGDLRHAWLDVYSKEEGWIDAVIFFDGRSWEMMDPTFASSGSSAESLREFIGDGSNYVALYYH